VNEIPHRSIIDLQGEGTVPDPPRQKDRVLAGDGLGLVPAHLTRSDVARLASVGKLGPQLREPVRGVASGSQQLVEMIRLY
jgi:hypothetical protein